MIRTSLRFTTLCAGLLLSASALALSLGDLSQKDATGGLKDALTQGAQLAVKQLSTPGGFSNNPDVRIELPGNLGKAAKAMKMFGKGEQVEALEASMNKAAEKAVPQAQAILVDAVKNMSVTDAKGILSGGDDSATQYLNKSSREPDSGQVPAGRQAGHRPGWRGSEVQRLRRAGQRPGAGQG